MTYIPTAQSIHALLKAAVDAGEASWNATGMHGAVLDYTCHRLREMFPAFEMWDLDMKDTQSGFDFSYGAFARFEGFVIDYDGLTPWDEYIFAQQRRACGAVREQYCAVNLKRWERTGLEKALGGVFVPAVDGVLNSLPQAELLNEQTPSARGIASQRRM